MTEHGRHRASTGSASSGRKPAWVAGVIALAVAAGVAVIVALVARPAPDRQGQPGATDPDEASSSPPRVEATRETTVDSGGVVAVQETLTLTGSGGAVARPSASTPTGMTFLSASVVSPDGRTTPFVAPVRVQPSGSLVVRARYRLDGCPDVLPASWPAPVLVSPSPTYVRSQQPVHTAAALCPRASPSARGLPGLSGEWLGGKGVALSLTWAGRDPLEVTAIGSVSGVAAVAGAVTRPCPSDRCVTVLRPGASGRVVLEPADPCPPGTDDDTLVLVVGREGSRTGPVALTIDGVHRAACRA